MGGTKVTAPEACFEDDAENVFGKLKGCGGGCGTELEGAATVDSLADEFVDPGLFCCKI
jgi:hypothetical protein